MLFLVILLAILGLGLSNMIISNTKGITNEKEEFLQFEGADGGIYAVAGWMYIYKRTDVPKEVTITQSYQVKMEVLGNSVRHPPGYSLMWKGFDAKLNSKSGPTQIEAIIFVPVTPAGYGNE